MLCVQGSLGVYMCVREYFPVDLRFQDDLQLSIFRLLMYDISVKNNGISHRLNRRTLISFAKMISLLSYLKTSLLHLAKASWTN